MKIIEAMKQIKDLQRKAEDYRGKIKMFHADYETETPTYGPTAQDQANQIATWLQGHESLVKEIGDLRFRIQKTNVVTNVHIQLGDVKVTKTIVQWLARRKDLANLDLTAWKCLTDKGLTGGMLKTTTGDTKEVRVRRYYDVKLRDKKCELYASEALAIDGALEVVNATTDLVD